MTDPDNTVRGKDAAVPVVADPRKRAAIAPLLEPGESVVWLGGPDLSSLVRTQLVLWYVGIPWIVIALVLIFVGWVPDGWALPALAPGIALVGGPFVLAYHRSGSVYAITDRRTIIHHPMQRRRRTTTVSFANIDAKLEVMETRPGFGHLYFASGLSTRTPDADFTGKLAFREVARPQAVAATLENAVAQWKSRRGGKPAE